MRTCGSNRSRLATIALTIVASAVSMSASAQPAAFPTSAEYVPLNCGGAPASDLNNDQSGASTDRDIVGDVTSPALLIAETTDFLFLRMRVDGTPLNAQMTGFSPSGFGWLFNTDSDLGTFEFSFVLSGQANALTLYRNTSTQKIGDFGDSPDAAPVLTIPNALTSGYVEVLDTTTDLFADAGTDFFVTIALSKDVLATNGLTGPSYRVWAATSSNGTTLNADAACHDGATGAPDLRFVPADPRAIDANYVTIADPVAGSATLDLTPTIAGTTTAGATVAVTLDGGAPLTTTADSSGQWSVTPSAVLTDDTTYTVVATSTATDGRVAIATLDFVVASGDIDQCAASTDNCNANAACTNLLDTAGPDFACTCLPGFVGDGVTCDGIVIASPTDGSMPVDPTPTVSGTAPANETVDVYVDGALACTAVADALGAFTCDSTVTLVDGSHVILATATIGTGMNAYTLVDTVTVFFGNLGAADTDGDGLSDAVERPGNVSIDSDADGVPNFADADDDNDGIPTATEIQLATDGGVAVDADGDGLANYLDTDADGDGIPDATEGIVDTDGNGIPDFLDTDSDGDAIPDMVEGTIDTDGDGMPDYVDADSDGDGIPDLVEGATDTDGDGTPNYLDADSDGDGLTDMVEGATDADGDGTPNFLDADSDGDGLTDMVEGATDTDGDGTPNFLDEDSDGDGAPDAAEGTSDADRDGIPDYIDADSQGAGFGLAGGAHCTVSTPGANGPIGSLALLGLALLAVAARRRRFRRGSIAAATLTLGLATSSTSFAQIQLDTFRAPETTRDGFGSRGTATRGHLVLDGQLYLDYANDPLVIERDLGNADSESAQVVHHQLNGHFLASLGLFDRANVFLGIPLVYVMKGDDVGVYGITGADGSGLGDLFLGGRYRLIGDETGDGFSLAGQITLTLPTADWADSRQAYRGDGNVSFHPMVLVQYRLGSLSLRGNVGARVRENRTVAGGTTLGDDFTYAIGATYTLLDDSLDLVADLYGSSSFHEFFDREATPFELLVGGRYRHSSGVSAGVAMGPGLVRGFGAPDLRVIGTLAFSRKLEAEEPEEEEPAVEEGPRDSDGDGMLDTEDGCPNEAEDRDGFEDSDGCPDPDNDRDGVLDANDGAPNEPEDADSFQDEDGVPDPDNDGDGIADADDRCPIVAGVAREHGCPEGDDDSDTVINRLDNCPAVAGPIANHGCPEQQRVAIEEGRLQILENVFFATNSDRILARSFPLLDNVAQVLTAHPEIDMVRVEGHTDSRGDHDRNVALSRRRAASVVRYLVAHGIAESRLVAQGFGPDRPVVPNATTPDDHARNRRVEFNLGDAVEGVENRQNQP